MLYYTEAHMKETINSVEALIAVAAQHEQDMAEVTTQRDALHSVLRQVVACFKSRVESSTCIEDHHPSCLAFIEARLKECDGRGQQGEAQRS